MPTAELLPLSHFHETFAQACFPVWIVDEELQVSGCNQYVREQYPAHVLPDGVRMFFTPENTLHVIEAIAAGLCLRVHPSATFRQNLHLTVTPFTCQEGRHAYVMLTLSNTMEDPDQQTLREALTSTGNLAITQGLRRGMSDILGALASCSTRLHGAGIELVDDQLRAINHSCYQLMRTTGNLAEQLKYGTGIAALLQPMDVWESTAHLLDAASTLLRASRLGFTYSLPETTVYVECDFDKLTIALLNLLSNSYLYGGPGTQVTVTGRDVGDQVMLTITDNGPGISAEMQERLFQPFSSWECLDRQTAGIGLGLHLVRRIITEAGGRVILNTGDTGTTVILSLPVCPPPQDADAQLHSTSLTYLQDRFSPLYFGLCDVVEIPKP